MDIKKISLNNTSYNIRDSRVTDNVVNGNAVWTSANSIAVTNAANGNVIKESGVSITTFLGSDNTTVPTSLAVKNAIDALPEPMIFKGSLGTGGTITSLPTASASNTGYTYKVITAGTYASQAAKVGDTFISDGSNWVLIPSGDEPSGTVTSVATGNGLTGGPITTSGTIALSAATESSIGGIKVGSGLSVTNDGTLSANISGKADKVSGATNGNLAALDSNGNLIDSGKSVSTTAVSTATHFLATDSSISSIAPITAANLASVLGAQIGWGGALQESADNIYTNSSYYVYGDTSKDTPTGHGVLITQCCTLTGNYGPSVVQTFYDSSDNNVFSRIAISGTWNDWKLVTYPFQDYTTLSDLAAALGGIGVITSDNIGSQSVNYANSAGSAQTARYADSAGSVAWGNVVDKPTIPVCTNVEMVGRAKIKSNTYTLDSTTNIWFIIHILNPHVLDYDSHYDISITAFYVRHNDTLKYQSCVSGRYVCHFNPWYESSGTNGTKYVVKENTNQGQDVKIGYYNWSSGPYVGSEYGSLGIYIPFCIKNTSSTMYDVVVEATVSGIDANVTVARYSGEISDYSWNDDEDVSSYYNYD